VLLESFVSLQHQALGFVPSDIPVTLTSSTHLHGPWQLGKVQFEIDRNILFGAWL
jgi:hypothetical protein